MDGFIYGLNYVLLLSCLFDLRCQNAEQRFSFSLLRLFLLIPLLVLEYLYFSAYPQDGLVPAVFFSENIFALTCIGLALSLQQVIFTETRQKPAYRLAPAGIVIAGLAMGVLWMLGKPVFEIIENDLLFPHYGQLFFSSLFFLIAILLMAWRLEAFLRTLAPKARWPYKYMVLGFFLLIGTIAWSMSFRLTYLHIKDAHLLLAAVLMATAWLLITYAIVSKRLLNRKIFISRKVVYSTAAPLVFACYLIGVGVVALLIRTFGWSLHFVLQWFLVVAGLLLISAFLVSGRFRSRVKYFISTHFYVNKYEYRDEWLAFSELLHRSLTEKGVVHALRQILQDSLYTDTIRIWIGDPEKGFSLTDFDQRAGDAAGAVLSADDPLVSYLQHHPVLDCQTAAAGPEQKQLMARKRDFFTQSEVVLLVPLAIGDHFVGIIGLGPEYTGGTYGRDDFDLLAALGSQAASALLAVRMAEELARSREQSAWNTLSAFVLHDIKNAANMLSLVKENAPQHIDNPEFQQDMLVCVEDALKRMTKVQTRLNTFKGEITPVWKAADPHDLLEGCCRNLGRKLPSLEIKTVIDARQSKIHTDPDFFAIIVENLLLNAFEAGGAGTRVTLRLQQNGNRQFRMECTDNGPGIPPEMLPDQLFEPFSTAKPKGSGIGLWQVKRLAESLNGRIRAEKSENGGARFLLTLPAESN